MQGILMLTRAEINRLRRNKRYLLFTVGLPVILYLLVAKQEATATVYGVPFPAYYMVAMATFGAFSGALNGNAIRISEERKVGWIRQLRLTPLPANGYVVAKILTSMVTTIFSVVIVLLLGRFYGGVHLALVDVAGDRGRGLARLDDLRRAGGGHRLPVPARPGAADHPPRLLRVPQPSAASGSRSAGRCRRSARAPRPTRR